MAIDDENSVRGGKSATEIVNNLHDKVYTTLSTSAKALINTSFVGNLEGLERDINDTMVKAIDDISILETKYKEEKLNGRGTAKSMLYEEAIKDSQNLYDEFTSVATSKYVETMVGSYKLALEASRNSSEFLSAEGKIQEVRNVIDGFKQIAVQKGWADLEQQPSYFQTALMKMESSLADLEQSYNSGLIQSFNQDIDYAIKQSSNLNNDAVKHLEDFITDFNDVSQRRDLDNKSSQQILTKAYGLLDIMKILSSNEQSLENSQKVSIDSRLSVTPEPEANNKQGPNSSPLPISQLYSQLDTYKVEQLRLAFADLISGTEEFKQNTAFLNNLKTVPVNTKESKQLDVLRTETMSEVNQKIINKIINNLEEIAEFIYGHGEKVNLKGLDNDNMKLTSRELLLTARIMLESPTIPPESEWKKKLEVIENKALNFEFNNIAKLMNPLADSLKSSPRFFDSLTGKKADQRARLVAINKLVAGVDQKDLSSDEIKKRASSMEKTLESRSFRQIAVDVFNAIEESLRSIFLGTRPTIRVESKGALEREIKGTAENIRGHSGPRSQI